MALRHVRCRCCGLCRERVLYKDTRLSERKRECMSWGSRPVLGHGRERRTQKRIILAGTVDPVSLRSSKAPL